MDKQVTFYSKLTYEKLGIVKSSQKKAKVINELEFGRANLKQFDSFFN